MNRIKTFCSFALMLTLLIAPMASAQQFTPQLATGVKTVSLSMTVSESLTLSVSPASVSFTYNPSTNSATASGPISVVTQWALAAGHQTVSTWAYFSPGPALTGPGGSTISGAQVFGSVDGQTPMTCNQIPASFPAAVAGTGVCTGTNTNNSILWTSATTTGTSTDTLLLSMANLANLPAGNFSGIINFIATVS